MDVKVNDGDLMPKDVADQYGLNYSEWVWSKGHGDYIQMIDATIGDTPLIDMEG